MFGASRAAGALAVVLALGAVAGCGGGEPLAALKAPGTEGVEALRQALQSALENHDDKKQCELFSPALLASSGSISACEKELSTEPGPYSHKLENYVAGGRISLTDNRAEYQAPPGAKDFATTSETYEGDAGGATVFDAVYVEGAWRITDIVSE
jgi:hypothetical protein